MKKNVFRQLLVTGLFTITTLSISLGSSPSLAEARPSIQSKAQKKALEKAAMRLYKNALRQYEVGDYWNATRELILILDYYTDFSAIDGVLYYLGESLYEMKMFRSSDKIYRYLINNYPASDFVPRALFGLQRIYYNIQKYDRSLQFYNGLVTRYRDSNVIDGAYYYGGMAFYHQKKYDEAIRALSKIRTRSEYFEYGLYTVGLAFLKKKVFHNPSKRCLS